MIVALDADCIDHADVEFARNNHGRRHAAAGDGDHGLPRAIIGALSVEPPGQCTGIAVELIPTDVKSLFMWQTISSHLASP